MGRTFVIGDIHGANKALVQCLEQCNFNYEKDSLICLGDICDGWPDVYNSIETILKIKNLTFVLGNHDFWALQWMKTSKAPSNWLRQGGEATVMSYPSSIPEKHIELLTKAHYYFIFHNQIYVHGGFNPLIDIEKQNPLELIWDRSLIFYAMNNAPMNGEQNKITKYDKVFIGHTPTTNYNSSEPIQIHEICMMDTGAGWVGGKLTMMDIESNAIYQSSEIQTLYPDYQGRKK